MRYLALATDYDGTLASHGRVEPETVAAVKRLQMSGRRAIIVTGRRLDDLMAAFPELDLFDCVVAENGALIYFPRTREKILLGKRPPQEFIDRMRNEGVPLETGEVILATHIPHHITAIRAIQELGMELLIIFNGEAVMILPAGINKAVGLDHALRRLGLSFHEVLGVGDSENDHSFLRACECSAAVANAVPSIRDRVDYVTAGEAGAGVTELIDGLIADDLAGVEDKLHQRFIAIGRKQDGGLALISPYGTNILVAGPSGSGKSTLTAGILERLMDQAYQVCIVDPEGDYGTIQKVITLGNQRHAVSVNEALSILEDPKINLNVNLLGIPLADRPAFFGQLFPSLRSLRTRTGRPHWVVLDEAHHMLSPEWGHLSEALSKELGETLFVTVHPERLPRAILSCMDLFIAVGPDPEKTFGNFCRASGHSLVWPDGLAYQKGHAVAWFPRRGESPFPIQIIRASGDRIRHRRKYAEGDVNIKSFYFRGPRGQHNLKAHNLSVFSTIAEGIEEETWLFHLRRGDYTRWFRDVVKDPYLAEQARSIEKRTELRPDETRSLITGLIEARYTLPE